MRVENGLEKNERVVVEQGLESRKTFEKRY